MVRKIALEEHFGTADPDIVEQSREHFTEQTWPPHRRRLLDVQDERLRLMDEAGIEIVVLSLLAPGIQGLPDRAQGRGLGAPHQRRRRAARGAETGSLRRVRRAWRCRTPKKPSSSCAAR